jgi:hypothetical protein
MFKDFGRFNQFQGQRGWIPHNLDRQFCRGDRIIFESFQRLKRKAFPTGSVGNDRIVEMPNRQHFFKECQLR